MSTVNAEKLSEVAQRIREMRIIENITEADMAAKTEVTLEQYLQYEAGMLDFPFTFLHKCAQVFGVGMTDLLEGQSAHLSSYTVTRKGEGHATAKENGIDVLWDDIAIDNPAIDMFLRHGFKEISRDEEEIDLRKEL